MGILKNKAMESVMRSIKGSMELEQVAKWIIGLLLLIVVIYFIIALRGKGINIIDKLRELRFW